MQQGLTSRVGRWQMTTTNVHLKCLVKQFGLRERLVARRPHVYEIPLRDSFSEMLVVAAVLGDCGVRQDGFPTIGRIIVTYPDLDVVWQGEHFGFRRVEL
jgi:hypothetical protein